MAKGSKTKSIGRKVSVNPVKAHAGKGKVPSSGRMPKKPQNRKK